MGATATAVLTAFGLKVLGAIAAWIVGRYLIRLAIRLTQAALARQSVDPTLGRYLGNVLSVALTVVLVVAILGFFGIETTSFAALLAALGIAIGAAWAGLLANFAAGAFLMVLRPFKVGDVVRVAGVEGAVQDIGLFATTLVTGDNVATFVRQRQDLRRHDPELLGESLAPGRPHRAARALGQLARRRAAAEGGAGADPEHAEEPAPRRRNPRLHRARPGARGAGLHAPPRKFGVGLIRGRSPNSTAGAAFGVRAPSPIQLGLRPRISLFRFRRGHELAGQL